MNLRKLAGSAFLVAMLCGCARLERQSLEPARAAADFESRNFENPELRAFCERHRPVPFPSWPPPLNITNLALAALYYHPEMDVARAKWATLQAGQKIAAEFPNPTLSVVPGYNSTTAIPTPWIVSASLDIPIETAGKRGYRMAQSAHLSQAAKLNIASAAWKTRARVRQAVLGLYAATESELLLRGQHRLQTESLRLSTAQNEAGAISAFELTQARINAETTRFLLRDAERLRAEAQADLADAVGVPLRALQEVQISFDGLQSLPNQFPLKEARQTALRSRADILSALSEYAASQSALQLEIAKQYPDIHLSPGYEFDQGDAKWTLGLGITLPIFNRNQGAIAEAGAKRAEAAANFISVQARALGEIDRAFASFQSAREKAVDAMALADSLANQEKSLRAMLDLGEISKADLIGLQLQLAASNLGRLDALAKAQTAMGTLHDALQISGEINPSAWEGATAGKPAISKH